MESLAPWITWRFSRSPGPGGQNVNKVATRVTLLFDFERCALLSDWQRGRIRARLASRMSADGLLRVVVHQDRSQSANRAAAGERLVELLAAAFVERKARKTTRPTKGSRERRLKTKRARSETKRRRGEIDQI